MMRSLEEMRTTVAGTSVTVAQTKEAFATRIPLRRYGAPEEVGRLMLFLASDREQFLYRWCLYGGRWELRRIQMNATGSLSCRERE
jgi:NAD(P)-dependent dehydrogenase (short-subunit alcohol dehydrogenase family)